jgi:hypothetical protein
VSLTGSPSEQVPQVSTTEFNTDAVLVGPAALKGAPAPCWALPILTRELMRRSLLSIGFVCLVLAGCSSRNGLPDGATADAKGGSATPCPGEVSPADCLHCGLPGPNDCQGPGGLGRAPFCTDDVRDPYRCCFLGLGQYCACLKDHWQVVACERPPREAGLPGPDASTGN